MTRAIVFLAALLMSSAALADDRHAGYYYPEITSTETFSRLIREPPPSDKTVRVDFITGLTAAQLAAPANPRFVFFAKGDDARSLIIIALDDDVFSTLYRARAVLAQMTSNMRKNQFFIQQDLQHVATFYDFLQFLDFDTLVISDGETWAHEVTFTDG